MSSSIEVPFVDAGNGKIVQDSWVCPECGASFGSRQALGGHTQIHKNRKPCPECGGMYLPGTGMSRHRITAHGLTLKNPKTKRKTCPECKKVISAQDLARHLRDVHGIYPTPRQRKVEPEPAWNVDDIFSTVVDLMWSGGEIPVRFLTSLIRWRDATQQMLTEIQGKNE